MSRLQLRVVTQPRRLGVTLRLLLGLTVCGLSVACSGGGGGEAEQERAEALEVAPQNEWDVMDWDEGEWAFVVPTARALPLA